MTDWTTTLTASDVERPLRDKLEDWEDAIQLSTDAATSAAAQRAAANVRSMTRGVAMINGAKDAVTTFLPGTTVAGMAASPHLAIGLKVLSIASDLSAPNVPGRRAVLDADYDRVRDAFMRRVRRAKDTFPSSVNGRALATELERAASNLIFKDSNSRNTWCARFLENIGAIELNRSTIERRVTSGFQPLFEKLGWIIGESLRDSNAPITRLFRDPNYVWNGFNIHIEGAGHRVNRHAWPGSEPARGLRRATSDEIRTVLTNMNSYAVTMRPLLVGTGYVAHQQRIVEVRNGQGGVRAQDPDIGPAINAIFTPTKIADAMVTTRSDVGTGVVSLTNGGSGMGAFTSGNEPPEAFRNAAGVMAP